MFKEFSSNSFPVLYTTDSYTPCREKIGLPLYLAAVIYYLHKSALRIAEVKYKR